MNDNSSETNPIQDDGVKKAFASVNRSEAGAALIIVLAFIMMLLVLLLAFFSKSTQQQQISKSSSTIDLADIFAQGAADTIIGDLKSEIVAGSSSNGFTNGTGINAVTNTLYYPVLLTDSKTGFVIAYSNAVPQLVGCTTNPNAQLPNLVKISTNLPFYSLKNISNTPVFGINRASISSSTNPSYNGRYISAARWNKPLLLPVTATNNYTPPSSAGFVAPSWILVSRNGSNPTNNASTNLNTNMLWSTTNPNTVIGRYAYAVYNEGGLLDANVAGYPSSLTNSASIPTNLSPAYKEGAYFADLTQIGMTPTQITALVGWRNYASSRNSGNFPSYTIPGYGTNYASNTLANTNGFLRVATNSVVLEGNTNTLTDRQFTSRQQLISFLINADPSSTNTFTALQSLGTFSRSLEQPSYQPPTNKPTVVKSVNQSDPALGGGNDQAFSSNSLINPSFLTIRVTNSFTRNDGSTAQLGEPLVKQRFPLNRLAWITYKGPSATLYQNSPNDPVILAYLSNGISLSLLTNGTASNIMSCYGLTWNSGSGNWTYFHGSTTGIYQLGQITGREPDFFELLKAAENVGSLAKGSTASESSDTSYGGSLQNPINYQQYCDTSVDYAIIQEGANIIDQFDPDSFPTRILYDDHLNNVGVQEFRGIEDLPYISRIRYGTIIMANAGVFNSAPLIAAGCYPLNSYAIYQNSATNSKGQYTELPMTLTNAGAGALLAIPEIWNPHDPTEAQPANSLIPLKLMITAQSRAPITNAPTNSFQLWCTNRTEAQLWWDSDGKGGVANTPTVNTNLGGGAGNGSSTNGLIPHFPVTFPGGYNPPPFTSIDTNTSSLIITYGANSANLYREPTLLAEANKPSGSTNRMSCTDPNFTNVLVDSTVKTTNGKAFCNGAINAPGTVNALNKTTNTYGSQYTGIFISIYPLAWVEGGRLSGVTDMNEVLYTPRKLFINFNPLPVMDYLLKYQDPSNTNNWITYDEKYVNVPGQNGHYFSPIGDNTYSTTLKPLAYGEYSGRTNTNTGFDNGNLIQGWATGFPNSELMASFADPRTSRFGAPLGNIANPTDFLNQVDSFTGSGQVAMVPLPAKYYNGNGAGWLDETNNVLYTQRSGNQPGFGTYFDGVDLTWSTWAAPGWHYFNIKSSSTGNLYQSALISQNSPYFPDNGLKYTRDNTAVAGDPTFYSDPDGVVRRASGGYFTNTQSSTSDGLPVATAMTNLPPVVSTSQAASRPRVLNRPFRSVGELGYVFSGTPWRNIDFSTPESGHSALLDIFCINPVSGTLPLSAGKVSLNTRQTNVLTAILSGGYRDEGNPTNPLISISPTDATNMATSIIGYTTTNPLINMADLVGRYKGTNLITNWGNQTNFTPILNSYHNIDGAASYAGISSVISNAISTNNLIQRYREAPIRALGAAGQTRVWNLMIDVVAQTGKYPPSAKGLDNFVVEGETRYWVHVAIDRLTGQILDKQVEVVKE